MFDDIRPFSDAEINSAMKRIANHVYFPVLSRFIFPELPPEDVKEMVRSINTIHEFQRKVMYRANERIIQESISDFSYNGIKNIKVNTPYMFVSNHRDIMLDASLLQNVLLDNGLDTSEITFGANLMQMDLVVDIGKSNKMFKIERPGNNMKEFYRYSLHQSDYMRQVITQKKQSVWIAQRNGRTKDGLDRTDIGVIKMFGLSRKSDTVKSISELNILPISVSYEWEPCDIQKTIELCKHKEGPYIKRPGEDVESILSGILQPKGRVCFNITEPLTEEELNKIDSTNSSTFYKEVANIIDKRICGHYHLYPNNYIAHDIIHNDTKYEEFYTEGQKKTFIQRMLMLDKYDVDFNMAKQIFLGIYANPVDSYNINNY